MTAPDHPLPLSSRLSAEEHLEVKVARAVLRARLVGSRMSNVEQRVTYTEQRGDAGWQNLLEEARVAIRIVRQEDYRRG